MCANVKEMMRIAHSDLSKLDMLKSSYFLLECLFAVKQETVAKIVYEEVFQGLYLLVDSLFQLVHTKFQEIRDYGDGLTLISIVSTGTNECLDCLSRFYKMVARGLDLTKK